MGQARDVPDEELLAELRTLAAARDHPPPALAEAARALFALHDLDAAVARLTE